ncbi:MAG: LysR family transcriptional regulator [Burkholderiaceae bacterium]
MNFRTLDLNLLRVFDRVMVERNVTRAAAELAMTQPAVSNALRRLREAVGEDLFVPGPTGVTPTAQAESLWPAVRSAMARLREVFDPQGFDPRHDARSFTLLMADATAAVLVPPMLDELERSYPAVDLRVEPLTSRDPRAQLGRGGADAAVGFFPDVARTLAAAAGRDDSVIDALYTCEYVCVMRRGHPLARRERLTLEEFCAARHVRVSFAGRAHGFVDEALAARGRSRRSVLTVSHFSTAAQAVARSDLLTVFPRSYLPVCGAAQDLVARAVPCPLPRIDVGLLWHRRHEREPGHRWLRALVAQVAEGRKTPLAADAAAQAPHGACALAAP